MTEMTARDPDYEAVVRASFARQGLMTNFAAELTRVEPGVVEIRVARRDDLTQQHGYFHAGVTTAIIDTACGYAARSLMDAGSDVLSVEFKINLIAPAAGEVVVARGRVVRAGRTITVCQGDAFVVAADGSERHCAALQATVMRIDAHAVGAPGGLGRGRRG